MRIFLLLLHILLFGHLLNIIMPSHAYDDIHFFRPIFFFGEPHLERPGLCNLTAYGSHGTHIAHRPHHFSCQPNPIPQATVSLTEIAILWSQNSIRGFFVSGYIPIRSFSVTNQQYSATTHQICSIARAQHQTFTTPPSSANYVRTGVGDVAIAAGWTINYEETRIIDFIDGTIQCGITLPTSTHPEPNYLFDIPLGYQGHTGYFIIGDASLGLFDWLTFGAHLQVIGFSPRFAYEQATTFQYTKKPGMGVTVGTFCKADHVILGLSVTAAYSFTHKGQDTALPCIPSSSGLPIPQFCDTAWSMHAIHIIVDYDFATYKNPYAPRMGFIWNKGFRGRHSVPFSLLGGLWDMSAVWVF